MSEDFDAADFESADFESADFECGTLTPTCTLNGKGLMVTSMSEFNEVIGGEYIVWDQTRGEAMKKLDVKGLARRWTVAFVEDNVAWSSGNALSFQETLGADEAVIFEVTDEVNTIVTTVKIKAVQIGPVQDLAGKNIRRCIVDLVEVSS
jgi:hypothetical protein